jgi:RNA-binding protein YlmH
MNGWEPDMNIDKEELIFKKRLLDLAKMAASRDICTYADFLNQHEISLFHSIKNELPNVNYELFGGYDEAERKILCFYGDNSVKAFSGYITCIRIVPVNKKFSDDLSHRDFLGSIMNLGIERSLIGDILVKEKEGYIFLKTSIAPFIIDNLLKIRHTSVRCDVIEEDAPEIKPEFESIRGTIASPRLDAIISVAFKTSRNSILSLISGGKVFVDGRLIESNSYILKEDETVSVRGHGKFIYKGLENQTKKGRYYVSLLKYI